MAEITDISHILEIYNHAITETTAVYHYKTHSLKERVEWYEKKLEEGYPVIVALLDNEVVGFATYGPFRMWPAYKYTIEHSVYVHPYQQRRGIGSALLKEIMRMAKEREYATMVAGIDASNKYSIAMHERLGFQYAGLIKKAGYKFGRWLDLAFYQVEFPGPTIPTEE
ncbi:MAG: GNAT family N-acetyltransferase [Firmicutes bacterium]|nr:GNAT family N-acetyltransferase [Bacillota bacterium]